MTGANQKYFIIIGTFLACLAVIIQYVLMVDNRVASIAETTVRFFSFFTILTNILLALYFMTTWLGSNTKLGQFFQRAGAMTAICVYITVVGMVYQLVLRQAWEPRGLQMLVDELLHTINPLYFVLYWYLFANKSRLKWTLIPAWLIYPLVYLIFILLGGSASGFYPYPFVHVADLGMQQVLLNSAGLMLVFVGFSALYVGAGKMLDRAQHRQKIPY